VSALLPDVHPHQSWFVRAALESKSMQDTSVKRYPKMKLRHAEMKIISITLDDGCGHLCGLLAALAVQGWLR
jgi:hypothetical protein